MDDDIEGAKPFEGEGRRRPWSPPRVILSELRATHGPVGKTPLDKTGGLTDQVTHSGSVGS
jgi:hypothetical protein